MTSRQVDWLRVLLAWGCLLALIGLGKFLQLGTGFDVWPLGEDRNWIDILQRGEGANAASLFWTINDRNPLSPWWYIAFRKVILNVDPGILFLRYAVGASLGLATYELIRAVCGSSLRLLAVTSGILVAVSMGNGYFDQIYWNFEAALVCSIISIICYLKSRESSEATNWYAAALVFWFIAIASYTIQSGAMVAIAYLAFVGRVGESRPLVQRGLASIRDSWPFVAIFIAFLLVWRTTTRIADTYAMSPSIRSFGASISEGLWHYDLQLLTHLVKESNPLAYLLVGAVLAAVLVSCLWREAEPRVGKHIPIGPLVSLVVVTLCIAGPTIAVESSAASWAPGTRWRMIYQFTTPVLYLASAVFGCALLGRKLWRAFLVCFGCLVTVSITFSLAQNRKQVEITHSERTLRDKILDLAVSAYLQGAPRRIQFLILRDPEFNWYSNDVLSPVYAQTWFNTNDISFRIIPNEELSGPYAPYWPIIFSEDKEGVRNAKLWDVTIPYQEVHFLAATATGITQKSQITRKELSGLQARWDRVSESAFFPVVKSGCDMKWSAEREYLGRGLSAVEFNGTKAYRWTVERNATLYLPRPCSSATSVIVKVAYALSAKNLQWLSLKINGQVVSLEREQMPDGRFRYVGALPRDSFSANGPVRAELSVPSLDPVRGADRVFGVELESIEWASSE